MISSANFAKPESAGGNARMRGENEHAPVGLGFLEACSVSNQVNATVIQRTLRESLQFTMVLLERVFGFLFEKAIPKAVDGSTMIRFILTGPIRRMNGFP